MASLKSDKSFDEASSTAERFMSILPVESVIAGSIRRKKPIVGDIDIVSVGLFPKKIDSAEFISGGDTLRTYLFEDTQINVMISNPGYYGATLLYATGSGEWGRLLRCKAKYMGYKLSRYGLFDRETGELIASKTEKDIFDSLEKDFVNPEDRR